MEEQPKKRDLWEKFALVLQSSGGLLTALTVALIGFFGSSYLKDREIAENVTRERMQAYETNVRIYTELMSRREDSESALRKDMFVSIIQSFFRPGTATLDERVLNLELLAYNFHESLNLKPLFIFLEEKVSAASDPRTKRYLDRLYNVATEISRKQMLVLESAGQKTDRIIDFENFQQNPGGFPLDEATLTLEGTTRQFSLFVLAVDKKKREVNVRLEIKSPKDTLGNVDMNSVEFRVGFFDFPMIDNTRLTHDQRVAVVLNAFEEGSADVTLAYFPGSYASLKEKPYYHDVVQKLMGANEGTKQRP
jgi:hypothetical protein